MKAMKCSNRGLYVGGVLAVTALVGLFEPSRGDAAPPIPPQMTAAQANAVERLTDLTVLRADASGVPTLIEADLGVFHTDSASLAAEADGLLRRLRGVLRANGSEQLRLRQANRSPNSGLVHYRMDQLINGREVIGGEVIIHVDERTSRVLSIDAQFLPGSGLPSQESLSAEDALRSGLAEINAVAPTILTTPRLAYARTPGARGYLVWAARVSYTDADGRSQIDEILVDATSGRFVQRLPQLHPVLNRQILQYPSGPLIVSEGGTTSDTSASNVYAFTGDFYNYFWNAHGRDAWDGSGGPMIAYVHGTDVGQNNAVFQCFSGPTGYTQFGDGDGVSYASFSAGRDVVAHEWMHGISCADSGLVYLGQSGALNEALSDIFGAVVEASVTGLTSNTWLIGEDVYTPGVSGDAFRYMANPTLDGHSRDYYSDLLPSDDVHYASGIANLAFYLLANGGSHPRGKNGIAVSGIGITKAARIMYRAQRFYLLATSQYVDARDATARAAQEEYGVGSAEWLSTCKAWDAVNVPNRGDFCPGHSSILTQGTFSAWGQTVRGFNQAIPIGSMGSPQTFNGKTFTAFADVAPQQTSFVRVSGFTSDPGASWLVKATAFGVTRYGVDATYTYAGGVATWGWPNGSAFGFSGSGTTTVTIVHGP